MATKSYLKLAALVFVSVVGFSFAQTKVAAAFALNPNPRPNGIPSNLADKLENCNGEDFSQSPAFWQWVSPNGAPASTSVTVPYGIGQIDLNLNWASAVCSSPNHVLESQLQTQSAEVVAIDGVPVSGAAAGAIFNAAGQVLPLNSGTNQGDYASNRYVFQYQPPGVVTTDHVYTIKFVNKSINHVDNDADAPYKCIAEPRNSADGGWNYGLCQDETPKFDIRINVGSRPPAGFLDKVDCNFAEGWARDDDFPSKQLVVQIYQDGWPGDPGSQYIEQAYADVDRADVGRHGFKIDVSSGNDAFSHTYYAVAQDLNQAGDWTGEWLHLSNGGMPAAGQPCARPTCEVSINGQPALNETFSVNLVVKYARGSKGRPIDPFGTMSVNGSPPTGHSFGQTWGNTAYAFPGFTQNGPGVIPANGRALQAGVFDTTCSTSFPVAALPYLKVFGNDIAAGGKFADKNAKECSANPTTTASEPPASIWTFNKKVSSNFYGGASSQFAAFAYGIMDRFNTAGTRNGQNTQPTTPSGLSFGNMVKSGNAPAAASENETGLSGMWNCIPDYFSASTKLPAAGASLRSGDISINNLGAPTSIGTGEKRVDFINGNAFVKSNITYANSNNWTSTAQIPNYYLIVKGDIYIASDVTALDGVYIAQPRDDGTGGNIYTCTYGPGGTDWLYNKSNLYNGCQQSLTVTGSFIAKHISFQRSRGTVENSTSGSVPTNEGPTCAPANNTQCNIGEIFNFSQELYLATPPSILSSVTSTGNNSKPYDSITSLPPIL